jgi:hypothetical protein
MSNVPEPVRRFLLTSIPSIPHLELLLLLWRERREVDVNELARRLYVEPLFAMSLVQDLRDADLVVPGTAEQSWRLWDGDEALVQLVSQLDRTYSRYVRAVADIVHGKTEGALTR